MNRAKTDIKNWKEGGNNYILKGNNRNKWVGYLENVLNELQLKFGDNFNIVIYIDPNDEKDYYCIPFSAVKHLFKEEHKTTGGWSKRWTSIILDHQFRMHSNSQFSVDISKFYARELLPTSSIIVDEDYYIENARAEINIRIGQSKFRNGVLKNFNFKCALTGISEINLLRASHIIPWSHKKEFRADVSNGICLYAEYDALFDEGYISFTDELKTLVCDINFVSKPLIEKLNSINGKKLIAPKKKEINKDYLEYHRTLIFKH